MSHAGPSAGSTPRFATIAATAAHHAEVRPDRIAVECGGRQLTFRELHERSDDTAQTLLADGITPGARVGYLARDTEHYHELLLACAKIGAVLVPVDPRLTPVEVEHVLRDAEVALLVTEPERRPGVERLRAALPGLRTVLDLGLPARSRPGASIPAATAGPGRPLMQMYTSGTTGAPKGVVLGEGSFWAVNDLLARHRLDWLELRADDRILHVLPGHHIGPPWWFLQGFRAGATSVIGQGFEGARTLALIRDGGITNTMMVPSMLRILLDEPGAGRDAFVGLRKVVYGGSPIPEELLRRCLDVMGCQFAQIYGLTETCASAVCLPPSDHVPGSSRLTAAGRPYPGVAVQIVDRAGHPLPAGQVGEVYLDTPAVMDGYWRRPRDTESALAGGWLHTGDAGYLDEDGYLYIRDRIKDVVLVAGENVYPAEVEKALGRHPAVAEVAVVGVPDQVRGEAVKAFVVPRPDHQPSPRELRTFLKDRLADYKAPTEYAFVAALPRNASGKVLRRQLRDLS
ncbi:long-chain-fatty-acid--CoA ligase [Micromonospora sp. NPDC049101]|uniref:long-chain-fatty-acid--CoA ligase n=1 Tax=unclassified Micromonospora TaxID=2617518 RepID=UPI003410CF69